MHGGKFPLPPKKHPLHLETYKLFEILMVFLYCVRPPSPKALKTMSIYTTMVVFRAPPLFPLAKCFSMCSSPTLFHSEEFSMPRKFQLYNLNVFEVFFLWWPVTIRSKFRQRHFKGLVSYSWKNILVSCFTPQFSPNCVQDTPILLEQFLYFLCDDQENCLPTLSMVLDTKE